MARNKNIDNPQPNSDTILSTSDKKIAKLAKEGGIVLGSDASDANNVKFHRSGAAALQIVPGDDTTAEGSVSPNNGNLLGTVLVGTIVAWNPGYFTNGSNGTYTNVLGSSVGAANSYANPFGWYVADGTVPSVTGSLIWNAGGRNLPNLTDNRFLMGATTPGTAAGSNTMLDHTHDGTHNHGSFSTTDSVGSHDHGGSTGGGGYAQALTNNRYDFMHDQRPVSTGTHTHSISADGAHNHTIDVPNFVGTVGSGNTASTTENRPQYLSTFYMVRVF